MDAEVEERESVLRELCHAVDAAFGDVPLLQAQLPSSKLQSPREAHPAVSPHTLLQYLGLVESLVVRLVGKQIAAKAAEAKAAKAAGAPSFATPGTSAAGGADSAAAEARPVSSGAAAPAAAASSGDVAGSGAASVGGRRGRVSVVPPPMTSVAEAASLTLAAEAARRAEEQRKQAEQDKLKYGRASLQSELMAEILAGVASQMDRLADEERGIKKDDGPEYASRRYASAGPLKVNKSQRDSSIEEWLTRRRGAPPSHGPAFGASSTASMGPALAKPRKGGAAATLKSLGSGARAQTKSAPTLFAVSSGREILNEVTRITADRMSSRAFAAEMLPRLPNVSEEQAALPLADGMLSAPLGASALESMGMLDGEPGGLSEPQREIEEINRRLMLLEQERKQIQQLKHMAVAAATAVPPPSSAQHSGAIPASAMPGAAVAPMIGGPRVLGSTPSLSSMPPVGRPPLSSGGSNAALVASRSSGALPLQPIPRQR